MKKTTKTIVFLINCLRNLCLLIYSKFKSTIRTEKIDEKTPKIPLDMKEQHNLRKHTKEKTLLLDLDETLIRSSFTPLLNQTFTIQANLFFNTKIVKKHEKL